MNGVWKTLRFRSQVYLSDERYGQGVCDWKQLLICRIIVWKNFFPTHSDRMPRCNTILCECLWVCCSNFQHEIYTKKYPRRVEKNDIFVFNGNNFWFSMKYTIILRFIKMKNCVKLSREQNMEHHTRLMHHLRHKTCKKRRRHGRRLFRPRAFLYTL